MISKVLALESNIMRSCCKYVWNADGTAHETVHTHQNAGQLRSWSRMFSWVVNHRPVDSKIHVMRDSLKNWHVHNYMQGNTEQCVQSCLSAFACNQTVMYGIVVVVDGLKLVKVERQQNPNAAMEYNISETDLVTWDRTDAMHAMFEMIEGILWRNGKRVSFEWESGVQRRKPYLLGFFPFAAIPENSRELLSNN